MAGAGSKKTQFKKGDKRINRAGQPRLSEEIKEARSLTTETFVKTFNDLLYMSINELKKIAKSKTEPSLRAYMASCLVVGKRRGDYYAMNLMLDRIIGKVREPADPDQENVLKELLAAMVSAATVAAKAPKPK